MSVEQMLAAARAEKSAAAEPVAPEAEPAAAESADEDEVEAASSGAAPSDLTDTDEIVAFCRQVDG